MPFSAAHPTLQLALQRQGYTVPTPVQASVLEADANRDLLVSAQTGSGKTVAFGLALAKAILGDATKAPPAGAPLALVVAPTRELAMQVQRELAWLYGETGARIETCVGGMDPRREYHALSRGVHIVVGTPGRLCDHLERRALRLDALKTVVLDEADEMLDMGFREDLERLLDAAPKERRTLMFSATIPRDIAALAKKFQKDALRIATAGEGDGHRDIEYQAIPIVPRERDLAVVNLLRFHDAVGALVFCATRDGVTRLAANLAERGFAVAALSGELSQRERNQALQALRDGRARVCVATDVAARGLDLPDLGLVIHADLPQNKQMLVHRSGRTGRAGRQGMAIVLVPDAARRHVERMLFSANAAVTWMAAPTPEQIVARDQLQLMKEISGLAAEVGDDDRHIARALLAERSGEDLVAALVRVRRNARPAPEELTVPPSMRPPRFERGAASDRHAQRTERPIRGSTFNDRHDRGGPPERTERPPMRKNDRPPIVTEGARKHDRTFSDARKNDRPPIVTEGARNTHDRPGRAYNAKPGRPDAHGPDGGRADAPDVSAKHDAGPPPTANRHMNEHTERFAPPVSDWATFTINIGRTKNADPKWLIPLLCRRGGVTKKDIGKIRVLVKETHVEIATAASARFAEAVRQPDPKDPKIHIEPLDAE